MSNDDDISGDGCRASGAARAADGRAEGSCLHLQRFGTFLLIIALIIVLIVLIGSGEIQLISFYLQNMFVVIFLVSQSQVKMSCKEEARKPNTVTYHR